MYIFTTVLYSILSQWYCVCSFHPLYYCMWHWNSMQMFVLYVPSVVVEQWLVAWLHNWVTSHRLNNAVYIDSFAQISIYCTIIWFIEQCNSHNRLHYWKLPYSLHCLVSNAAVSSASSVCMVFLPSRLVCWEVNLVVLLLLCVIPYTCQLSSCPIRNWRYTQFKRMCSHTYDIVTDHSVRWFLTFTQCTLLIQNVMHS